VTRYFALDAVHGVLIIDALDFDLLGYWHFHLEILVGVDVILVQSDDFLRLAQFFHLHQLLLDAPLHVIQMNFQTLSDLQHFLRHLQRFSRHLVQLVKKGFEILYSTIPLES
jgi:hypothetical protein